MQELVQDRLHEFVDDRLSRWWVAAEEGGSQCNHADDHRHGRVGGHIWLTRTDSAQAHPFGADLTEESERPSDVGTPARSSWRGG
jgi:hypothetical protein